MQEHPSWWRKLARAEYHFEELTRLVRRYEDEHHYRAVLVDGLPERRFVLEITEQPDADIAVVLGDCLFNIRSALDHIAVACAGMDVRHKAQFPIVLDRMKRPAQTLKDQLAWFPLDAAAIIEAEQPLVMARCQFPPTAGRTVIATLEFLSELQNADKHRALNVVVPRVVRPSVRAIWREREIPVPQHHFLTPCANVLTAADVPTAVPLDEIDVSVFGTPEVAVKAPDLPEEYALLSVTLGILHHVEASIIPSLEPYARP